MSSLKPVYTGKATATGGGRDGHVVTDDKRIDLDVRRPEEMGGDGQGTNPEQLVGAGWAACFNGAVHAILDQEKISVPRDPEVEVLATINKSDSGMVITADITATFFDLDQEQADDVVSKAHDMCPYSNAMKTVDTTVTAKVA